MRALVQRVSRARVVVEGHEVGAIGRGLLIFLGVHPSDDGALAGWMAKKCAQLRVFPDEAGKMNRSLLDIRGEALVVSQFTLYGDTQKGNRPSYIAAAPPGLAEPMYERFLGHLEGELGRPVARGRFAADMQVELVNDGPVTLWITKEAT